jgi:nucleoside 2-deoxyribosyltransferase
MNEKKYQIFISSTYDDLREEREAAIKTILSLYHIPIGMEMFNAGDNDQWTVISQTIEISDYYVVIIGGRYGSTTDSGVSYTEKEYDYAISKGIPVLAFIKDENSPSIPTQRETDVTKQQKLSDFCGKLKNKYVDFWETKDDFSTKLSISLHKVFKEQPRIGWVRATQENTPNKELSKAELIELTKKIIHEEIKPVSNMEIDEIIKGSI